MLVIPFIVPTDGVPKYGILKREISTGGYWQFVAGGGEDGEEPIAAARRESSEEIGSDPHAALIELDSLTMIPVADVGGFEWGKDVLVIPEYCYGIELLSEELSLSDEHTDYRWLSFEEAKNVLHWESNKIALWELNHRLTNDIAGSSN